MLDPIEILVTAIDETMTGDHVDTLLNAIYYLRTGKFPFHRKAK